MNIKCKKCGRDFSSSKYKFCPNCGNAFTDTDSKTIDSKQRRSCDTFEQFKAKKSQQRATFFRGKTKSSTPQNKDVLINIGVMKYDRDSLDSSNEYTPIRGKSLPLKIKKEANYAQLLTAALVKRKAYDQAFNEKLDWNIHYPDGQIALNLPGQTESPFRLCDYKEDLGKNYSRITLYLCTESADENTESVEKDMFISSSDGNEYDQSMDVKTSQNNTDKNPSDAVTYVQSTSDLTYHGTNEGPSTSTLMQDDVDWLYASLFVM
ncbi:uncharacterized protein LOC114544973 [Dendronephthya gigantea]|uniref:uncharacterized protein LOC114544973 n=1 Tax=Dendronephthya gigantea TaxID=151771 RepID=UPI00106C915A|nr:uncharacterized protein LOC114544973 [Dendronephthya gigantea]